MQSFHGYLHMALLFALAAMLCLPASRAHAIDEDNCLICHGHRGMCYVDKENNFRLLYISESVYYNSPHGLFNCRSCHTDIKEIPHKAAEKVNCLMECHLEGKFKEGVFSHAPIEKILSSSVHSPVDENGKQKPYAEDYPTCKTCHQDPLYRPLSFFKKVRPGVSEKIMSRCLTCHDDKMFVRKFYSHFTSRMQKSRSGAEIIALCSRCHEDAGFLKRHDQPNVVYAYWETYHGKAVRFGDDAAPDCLDCHAGFMGSIHSMHTKTDPRSAVHPDNREAVCSNIDCHPGASSKLMDYKVHLLADRNRHPAEYYVSLFFVILTLMSFMPIMLAAILDLIRDLLPGSHGFENRALPPRPMVDGVALGASEPAIIEKKGKRYFRHLTVNQRWQHIVLMVSFGGLALTGLPLKYAHVSWLHELYLMLGGIELSTVLHRVFAVVMGLVFVYHFIYIGVVYIRWYLAPLWRAGKLTLVNAVKSALCLPMVPTVDDLVNVWKHCKYRLFLAKTKPAAGRFNLKEKFGYLAVFWGVPVIGLSGIILWGEEIYTKILPGNFLNFCLIAHSDEALLACIVIFLWHLYNTHLKLEYFPMGLSWLTGKKKESEIIQEHYGYYLGALQQQGLAPAQQGKKPGSLHRIARTGARLGILLFLILATGYLSWLVFNTVFGFHMRTIGRIPEKHYLAKPSFLEEVLLEGTEQKKFYRGFRVLKEQEVSDHFHNITLQVGPDKRSFCIQCHGDFPHGKKEETRAYLNMHDFFLACQTCHIRPQEGEQPYVYKWYKRDTGEILDEIPDLDANPIDALNIKLIPGIPTAGGWQRLDSDEQIRFAADFLKAVEIGGISLDEKKRHIQKIHGSVSKQSITCGQCHTPKTPFIPLREIGYSDDRARYIASSEVVSMIERFGDFSYPRIFERKR